MSLTRLLSVLPEPLFSTYTIDRVLGVGAYAVVYQIKDVHTEEVFALKVIEKEPMRVRLMLPQLTREVTLLQVHSDTPYVVQLLETIMTGTHVFLRSELCQDSLESVSQLHGPMSEDEALGWFRQACYGMKCLHDCGVIHRDLKPANFLVDYDGKLRICDFGWACTEEDELTGKCGTPEYSPPETATDEGPVHTTKVDVYGLAATLQHLLLGRVPQGPKDLPVGLSSEIHNLLAELLASDPDNRPTVADVLSRPEIQESIASQIWNQWRSFFDVKRMVNKSTLSQGGVVGCGIGRFG